MSVSKRKSTPLHYGISMGENVWEDNLVGKTEMHGRLCKSVAVGCEANSKLECLAKAWKSLKGEREFQGERWGGRGLKGGQQDVQAKTCGRRLEMGVSEIYRRKGEGVDLKGRQKGIWRSCQDRSLLSKR